MRALGYTRVSTGDQADNGVSLSAQREAIRAECRRRPGWELLDVIEDAGRSARNMKRPGICRARAMLKAGEVDALIVAKLDRLSRSMLDFATILDASHREGWKIVALDLGFDTSTDHGEMVANSLMNFAQFERRMMGSRMRAHHVEKRRQDPTYKPGPGGPTDKRTRARIRRARTGGDSYAAIAERLNAAAVATPSGSGRWHPATIRRVERSL
ncbi:MAG: recombinase family protein [Actinomycetota bacterium]